MSIENPFGESGKKATESLNKSRREIQKDIVGLGPDQIEEASKKKELLDRLEKSAKESGFDIAA